MSQSLSTDYPAIDTSTSTSTQIPNRARRPINDILLTALVGNPIAAIRLLLAGVRLALWQRELTNAFWTMLEDCSWGAVGSALSSGRLRCTLPIPATGSGIENGDEICDEDNVAATSSASASVAVSADLPADDLPDGVDPPLSSP